MSYIELQQQWYAVFEQLGIYLALAMIGLFLLKVLLHKHLWLKLILFVPLAIIYLFVIVFNYVIAVAEHS